MDFPWPCALIRPRIWKESLRPPATESHILECAVSFRPPLIWSSREAQEGTKFPIYRIAYLAQPWAFPGVFQRFLREVRIVDPHIPDRLELFLRERNTLTSRQLVSFFLSSRRAVALSKPSRSLFFGIPLVMYLSTFFSGIVFALSFTRGVAIPQPDGNQRRQAQDPHVVDRQRADGVKEAFVHVDGLQEIRVPQ